MSEPILSALSYSAGRQSNVLLEMILRGEIKKPDSFIVLNADPGMENERSYELVSDLSTRCKEAGIPFFTEHTTLYHDLITFKERGLTRIDNPPYWTRNRETGKRGKLTQSCTKAYKIAAMRRALRRYLHDRFNVSLTTTHLPKVEMWIGFAADEQHRANKAKSDVKYISLRFPLIEMGMTKAHCVGWFMKNGLDLPPPSVCNACYSNGLAFFEDMYLNRPDDWEQAVRVDEAIRDMRQLGIKDECFVSSTLTPLKDLPALNFKKEDADYLEHRCNSGACFI